MKIADVAGGKGYLRLALSEHGFNDVTTWDKRKKRLKKGNQIYRWFLYDQAPSDYDAIIGMHPDEGTDHIIMYAAKHRVPFILCPCCIKPNAVAYWGNHKYQNWLNHLENMCKRHNIETVHTILKMNGKNDVIIGRPK